ncbi:MAG: (2Fe-2S)-binding protein, partial [Nitrospinota bacterium]|nr:(2Fe-2S)-binding protein [Nitrospinota bacterium]
ICVSGDLGLKQTIPAWDLYILKTQKELIEDFKKVCICRNIKKITIMNAIQEGSLSFVALRRSIGSGTGNCKAKRCRAKIEQIVKDYKKSLEEENSESFHLNR